MYWIYGNKIKEEKLDAIKLLKLYDTQFKEWWINGVIYNYDIHTKCFSNILWIYTTNENKKIILDFIPEKYHPILKFDLYKDSPKL